MEGKQKFGGKMLWVRMASANCTPLHRSERETGGDIKGIDWGLGMNRKRLLGGGATGSMLTGRYDASPLI